MRILVADNTGLVKDVQVEDQKISASFGKQEKGMPIKNLVRVGENYFASSHEDCAVRIYCLNDTTYTFEAPLKHQSEIMSLSFDQDKIYALQKDGSVSLVEILYEEDMPYLEEPQSLFKVNATQANRAKLSPYDNSRLVVLSQGTNPQIFDLNEKKAFWKGKNVKNDYLDLTVPIHDLDCAFKSENEFYVSTAYHKIRLYDIRTKNCKPVIDYEFPHSKHPLNNILLSHCQNYAYVSDQGGDIFNLDLRKDFKIVGKLKGALGSIRDMVMSKSHPYLASVSLDRYLRVYNTNTNTLYRKIYLKQKLSSVILIDEEVEERDDEENPEENKIIKPVKPQNEVKNKAKQMRAMAKKARLRLTFEKKVTNKEEIEEEEYDEEYNQEYEPNDVDQDEYEEY